MQVIGLKFSDERLRRLEEVMITALRTTSAGLATVEARGKAGDAAMPNETDGGLRRSRCWMNNSRAISIGH